MVQGENGTNVGWSGRFWARKDLKDVLEVCAGVIFGQLFEDGVVDGLYGAGYEEAVGVAEGGDLVFVFAEMLNFDCGVVGDLREFPVERFDQRDGVADAVEEIWIAEGDVFGAGFHLAADVFEDHVVRDYAERAVVDGDDRAMAAEMFAAARGFGVTGDARGAVGESQRGITIERGQSLAIGDLEILALEGDQRLALRWMLLRLSPFFARLVAKAARPASNSPPRIVCTPRLRR